jgi:DegV family protein with EDD domain
MSNNNVAVIVDSTSTIPDDVIREYGMHVIPLTLVWGNETFLDGVDMSASEFYDKLRSDPVFPSTTQPSVAEFEELYKRVGGEASDILVVTLSGELSGTLNSAVQAKSMMPDMSIEIIDTRTMSMAAGYVALAAAREAKAGGSLAACVEAAKAANENVGVLVTLDSLEYLHRGGRIGGARKLLGGALNIKPILTVADGIVQDAGKVRTRRKALKHLITSVTDAVDGKSGVRLAGLHASSPDDAAFVLEECGTAVNAVETLMTELSPVVGAHVGPGGVGIAWSFD